MNKTVVHSNIAARLERLPLSWPHRKLLLIHGFGWFFDAMDVGLLTYILVDLSKDWNLTLPQTGLVGSAGILGMCVGSGVSGWLGDKLGRKTVFQVTLLVYAVATALCALAWDLPSMLCFRFLVGLGLGGEFPVVSSLLAEFIPGKHRGRYVVYLQSFWVYGWLVAAVAAYLLVPAYGWRITFLVGAVPAFYVWVVRRALPESPRWFVSKGRMAEAEAVVAQLEREVVKSTREALVAVEGEGRLEEVDEGKVPLRELWSREYRRRTVMLWILWFGLVFSFYGISTWTPKMLVEAGYDMKKMFELLIIVSFAQVPGYFSAAYLIERLGRKPVIVAFLLGFAVTGYLFGQARGDVQIVVWASLMNFCNLGVWGAVYTYTSELYPTAVRATGSGSAAAFGRIGGIVSPIAIGLLLAPIKIGGVLMMIAAFLVMGAMAVWILGSETKGKSLEASSAPANTNANEPVGV